MKSATALKAVLKLDTAPDTSRPGAYSSPPRPPRCHDSIPRQNRTGIKNFWELELRAILRFSRQASERWPLAFRGSKQAQTPCANFKREIKAERLTVDHLLRSKDTVTRRLADRDPLSEVKNTVS